MDLKTYLKKCGESANKKGWLVTWENLPQYLMATLHEITSGFDEGWRDDNKEKMAEELGDCFIRLMHICHDLNIDLEEIVLRLAKENESRPYKHNRKRM